MVGSALNAVRERVRAKPWLLLTLLPLVLWPSFRFAVGERRWEYVAIIVGCPLLAYWNERTNRLYVGLYPIGVLGLVYDMMRFVKNWGLSPERIHICDLRAIEMSIFGIGSGSSRTTVHDWIQAHPSPWLDRFFAIPYGTFIFASLAFAIFLYVKDYEAMRVFCWTFLLMNLMGFVTYHVYPAAPPWYYHAYGCHVDLAARASEGANLARVDAWMGFPYFAGFYGRSNDVFGAVPSLHVAYPLLILLYGYRRSGVGLRVASIAFFVSMCLAAVYLDHHWIVDVLLGFLYTVAANWIAKLVVERLHGPVAERATA